MHITLLKDFEVKALNLMGTAKNKHVFLHSWAIRIFFKKMLTCFILGFALGNRLADKTDVNGEIQSSGKGFGMDGISGILNSAFFVLY